MLNLWCHYKSHWHAFFCEAFFFFFIAARDRTQRTKPKYSLIYNFIKQQWSEFFWMMQTKYINFKREISMIRIVWSEFGKLTTVQMIWCISGAASNLGIFYHLNLWINVNFMVRVWLVCQIWKLKSYINKWWQIKQLVLSHDVLSFT